MAKNLIIHIGSVKVGGSKIRNFLHENLNNLNKQNFFPLLHKCNRCSHNWLRQPIEDFLEPQYSNMLRTILSCTTSMCKEDDLNAFQEILTEYDNSGENIIMTSDFFSLVKNPNLLLKPAKRDNGFAILFVKSQLEIIENLICELVLDPLISFEDAIQNGMNYELDFYKLSQLWTNIDNFEPCRVFSSENILNSFISTTNIKSDSLNFDSEEEQPKLPTSVIKYLYSKKQSVDNEYWFNIVKFFKTHPNVLKFKNTSLLNEQQQQIIIDKFKESNSKLIEKYPSLSTTMNLTIKNIEDSIVDTAYLDKVFSIALKYSPKE